jgi:hypothetical protein
MKALKLISMREVRDPKSIMAQIDHHRHLTSGKTAFLPGSLGCVSLRKAESLKRC